MTDATTTTAADFEAAVIANPADDLPRLVYCDWLEERAGFDTCTTCDGDGTIEEPVSRIGTRTRVRTCPTCQGTRSVSNGYAERSEFIRTQIELAKLPDLVKYEALRNRETALFNEHSQEWSKPVARLCEVPVEYGVLLSLPSFTSGGGHSNRVDSGQLPGRSARVVVGVSWKFVRGFVGAVFCSTATFLGGRCGVCLNWGREASEMATDGSPYCPACRGSGLVAKPVGVPLVKVAPIEFVYLTDLQPASGQDDRGESEVWLYSENGYHAPAGETVPGYLFDEIESPVDYVDSDMQIPFKRFRGATDMRAKVSAAALRVVRREAAQ